MSLHFGSLEDGKRLQTLCVAVSLPCLDKRLQETLSDGRVVNGETKTESVELNTEGFMRSADDFDACFFRSLQTEKDAPSHQL